MDKNTPVLFNSLMYSFLLTTVIHSQLPLSIKTAFSSKTPLPSSVPLPKADTRGCFMFHVSSSQPKNQEILLGHMLEDKQ